MKPDLKQQLDAKNSELAEILYAHYHYWNNKSGQSRGLIKKNHWKTGDRSRPLQPAIPWKVALDSLRSGYNVGSIIRSSEAFGLSEVIIGGNSPGPDNKAVRSAAMGTENWIRLTPAADLTQWLDETAETAEAEIIGLELSAKAFDFVGVEFPPKGVLILGNEERGISPSVLKRCSRLVNIPLFGRKFSLNVASAFAILAHGLRRQFHLQKAP